jgi:hypothetical protein
MTFTVAPIKWVLSGTRQSENYQNIVHTEPCHEEKENIFLKNMQGLADELAKKPGKEIADSADSDHIFITDGNPGDNGDGNDSRKEEGEIYVASEVGEVSEVASFSF